MQQVLNVVKENPVVVNNILHYPDGEGRMHRTPEEAAEFIHQFIEERKKEWYNLTLELAKSIKLC